MLVGVNATLRPIYPRTHCTGSWMGVTAVLDGCGKYRPNRDSVPGLSSPYRLRSPGLEEWIIYS